MSSRPPKLWNATIETHRAAVRDAILDATMALIRERGLRAVTMADIAARAGIGRATLYKYFGDAEAILRAWHEREIGRHLGEVGVIAEGRGDPGARLAAVLERYALNAQSGRGGHDADMAAVLHRDERVAAAHRRLRRLVAGLIREAGIYALNKLLIHAQPAHLAALAGVGRGDADLPRRRAAYVRGVLAEEAGRRGGGPEAG